MKRSAGFLKNLAIVLIFIQLSVLAGAEVPDDLIVMTENYPPMSFMDNETLSGISVDIVDSVLSGLGGPGKDAYLLMSWPEAYQKTLDTNNSILFSVARTPSREDKFLWAGPVVSIPTVYFCLNTSIAPDPARTWMVAITDDVGAIEAEQDGYSGDNLILVDTVEEAVRMMENREVDLFSYAELPGWYLIREYASDPSAFHEIEKKENLEYYIAFNTMTSPDFVAQVQENLNRMKQVRDETGITEYERILALYESPRCSEISVDEDLVMDLVHLTAGDVGKDAPGTFALINAGNPPYLDAGNPNLYVFVYDLNTTMMAHGSNPTMIGTNWSGKKDINGFAFRDAIITGAKENGSGWVEYVYSSPSESGLFWKDSYYELVLGSDGEEYVVVAGRYLSCEEDELFSS